MKLFAKMSIALPLLVFGACATAAQRELTRMNDKSNATYAAMNECGQKVDASDSAKIAQRRLLVDPTDPRKLEKLTINDHATAEEKRALLETTRLAAECRKIAIEGFSEVHLDAVVERISFYNAIDGLYVQLLRDELTIGQFNEKSDKARTNFAERWAALGRRLDGELQVAHQSEIAQRQALAQTFQDWAVQQQAIAARQQAAMAQHQSAINSMSPTYTNCNVVGNNVRCTTTH